MRLLALRMNGNLIINFFELKTTKCFKFDRILKFSMTNFLSKS